MRTAETVARAVEADHALRKDDPSFEDRRRAGRAFLDVLKTPLEWVKLPSRANEAYIRAIDVVKEAPGGVDAHARQGAYGSINVNVARRIRQVLAEDDERFRPRGK